MNIRRRGLVRQQRFAWGIPPIQEGDWYAERTGNLVYLKRPWEMSPLVRVPAMGEDGIVGTVLDTISGAQDAVAEQTATSVIDALRPYVWWAAVGGAALMIASGVVGYSIGRSAR